MKDVLNLLSWDSSDDMLSTHLTACKRIIHTFCEAWGVDGITVEDWLENLYGQDSPWRRAMTRAPLFALGAADQRVSLNNVNNVAEASVQSFRKVAMNRRVPHDLAQLLSRIPSYVLAEGTVATQEVMRRAGQRFSDKAVAAAARATQRAEHGGVRKVCRDVYMVKPLNPGASAAEGEVEEEEVDTTVLPLEDAVAQLLAARQTATEWSKLQNLAEGAEFERTVQKLFPETRTNPQELVLKVQELRQTPAVWTYVEERLGSAEQLCRL